LLSGVPGTTKGFRRTKRKTGKRKIGSAQEER